MLTRLEEYDEALFLNAKGIRVTQIDDTTKPESHSNPEVSQDAHPSLAATEDVVDTLTVP
ncbi:hypothetical protein DS67_03780 [Mesotoga sp. SC_4PWA21]|nr:hypothetical protein DS67_03780 [Mesotoga sp. SC_4PWA21]